MSNINRRLSNPLQQRLSTTHFISAELRNAIVQGRLFPGEPLRQESLARHFNVSHIPIREALRQLESEGWVTIAQHKGATVTPLDAGEAREIYEMRTALECLALDHAIPAHTPASLSLARSKLQAATDEPSERLFAQRNEEFHAALYAPAQRPHLQAAIEQLHRRGERYLRLKLLQPKMKSESDAEHLELFEACVRRDTAAATSILARHLLGTGELVARHLGDVVHAPSAAVKPSARRKRA